jgi:hypothetical protein
MLQSCPHHEAADAAEPVDRNPHRHVLSLQRMRVAPV